MSGYTIPAGIITAVIVVLAVMFGWAALLDARDAVRRTLRRQKRDD